MYNHDEKLKAIFNKNEQLILERILTLKHIIKEKRATPLDYHDLAIHYFLIKNYKNCIEALNQLIQTFPGYIDIDRVYRLRIVSFVFMEKYQEAMSEIQNRLQYNNQDTFLLHSLAYCYEKLRDYRQAIEIHRKILNIDPDRPSSLNAYGYLLTLHGSPQEIQLAGTYIKRALEKKPRNPYYLHSLSTYFYKTGKKDLAKKAIIKALQLDPENLEIMMDLKKYLNKNK